MAKEQKTGILIMHYYPFIKRIEKGTPCTIISESEEFYEVRFNLVGYGGTYSVNKSMIEEVS